jgi:hypothetical protein
MSTRVSRVAAAGAHGRPRTPVPDLVKRDFTATPTWIATEAGQYPIY